MLQIVITLNPETNQINVTSPVSPGDCLLLLERAKATVLHHASQPKTLLAVPTPDVEQALLQTGRRHARGS